MVLSKMNCSLMMVLAHSPVITNHHTRVHCIPKIAQHRLHNFSFSMQGYTLYCTLYSIQCIQYTVYSVYSIVHGMLDTAYCCSPMVVAHSATHPLHTVQSILHATLHCTAYWCSPLVAADCHYQSSSQQKQL